MSFNKFFSYTDRKYFASGHLTHDIAIGYMTPCIRYWKSLFGHDRTPWVLTFDPIVPHILYSGCLDGKVCKWNIHVCVVVCVSIYRSLVGIFHCYFHYGEPKNVIVAAPQTVSYYDDVLMQ